MGDRTYSLARKTWDSDFFGREIYSLNLEESAWDTNLATEVAELDRQGVWGIECELDASHFDLAPSLEDLGFRLVDSRMVFISKMSQGDQYASEPPYGTFRLACRADLAAVSELTATCLVDNDAFKSRYNNRRLFSREESVRYYDAWNHRAFTEAPGTFVLWDVEGAVVAYFNYIPSGEFDGLPMFKGVLTAVHRDHRGHGVQNTMQGYLFNSFGCDEWALDNTTQMTNVIVIKNHMRANKQFQTCSLIFYRVRNPAGSHGH